MTTNRLLHTALPNQHPYLRRVHVRRDEEGRWFWVHYACRTARAEIATFDVALGQAFEHARGVPCPRPEKSFVDHIEVDCGGNRQQASWLCPWCRQYCASHNPCDCCQDTSADD